MASSPLLSVFGVLNKLQEKFSSTASSSCTFDVPKLKQVNDMVYEVHSPQPGEKPDVEVVFFHGLQVGRSEDPYVTTWMTRDNSQLWLRTWLVELFPKARIFTVSYDSSAKRTHDSGRLDMYCTGENLVSSLTADEVRIGQAGCPVVLVGHCLGGLVLKEFCLHAAWMLGRKSAERFGVQRVDDLFSNLRGMFFYATPHTGSIVGDELHDYFKGTLLEEIKTMKASSARRNQEFADLKSKYGWLTSGIGEVHETYVECLDKQIHMVPEASTRPYMDTYYSAAADHYNVCKPQSKNDSALLHLQDFLKKIQNDGVLRASATADFQSGREYVVDLEGRANQVRSMLDRPDTRTIFIVGLSGIGKTTLAQQVFHDISHGFSVACFVSLDTIDAPSKSNCREQVLRKIQDALEGFSKGSNHSLSSVLSHLKGRRVLIVLDNVEFEDQLKALDAESWLDGSASKLIITTTHARLGTPSNTFQVPYLNDAESRQLFCRYAFTDGQEPQELKHLVSRLIKECGNFPLSLKVVGGYISKEDFHDERLWLDLFERLRKAEEVNGSHDCKILAKLRLCYEALTPSDQEIYLDIATFFHGFPFDLVKCIWETSRDSSYLGWTNLGRRFLANLDGNGRVWMHRLLRNVGQSIACPRNNGIDKWTRISRSSYAKELIAKHQGVVDTLALKLQVRETEILTIKKTTFLNYVRLESLILEGVSTSPGTLALPNSLVYLRWKDGLFTCCPVDFNRLEKLVALELIDCKSMKFLPPSVVKASKLMWLELGGCLSLAELPLGLSRFLEHLGLNGTCLKNLPSDLGKFKGLRHLQANGSQLTQVPQGLGRLQMLSSLDLRGTRLRTLPECLGDLKRLKNLDLQETMVTSLPDGIGRLQELETLLLERTQLGSLPESIGGLRSLKTLNLNSTCVKSLPKSFGDLVNLEYLHAAATPLETLPDSICDLRHLFWLDLTNSQISGLPDAMGELVALDTLQVCSRRLRSWGKTTGMLSRLETLVVDLGLLCENPALSLQLGEVEGRGEENTLALRDGESEMGIHSFLSQLPLLHAVSHLTLLGSSFPEHWLQPLFLALQRMPSLRTLYLLYFKLVEIIPCELCTLTNLEDMVLLGFETLLELPESLGELTRLEHLDLWDLPKLCRLPESLGELTRLTGLNLRMLPKLCRLPDSLSALPSLSRLRIDGCASLQSVPRSFSCGSALESEASTSLGRNCSRLAYEKPVRIEIIYVVPCKEMEKVSKRAIQRGKRLVVDTKVMREIVTEIGLHFLGDDHGRHEGSRPCSFTSSCRCRVPSQVSGIRCENYRSCSIHKYVEVNCLQDESDKTEDQENVMDLCEEGDEDSNEEGNEVLVIKYLRALWSCLLCSG